ncbi:MAG: Glycosyl transferase family 2 [Candidatus Amesbacteria bacterium GW2011_GWB1_47_19]|nr:MAG: Glycosyl transferase family 2 [Candidatus Amesbacteria bacterium GW2011_GWA1_44_24]KKU31368.1 MAG: Glycosyl transferase family 2 [Candidatus Amesbacteria bacterium GW2011_GWC1_46_24]KKU66979.1 MAG: Glycosyl transferase family 2 [Candidatus Amesbacteria bacterium GW2011_GWB1_47_19]HBC72803.1 hypothetical protein [Candidatus Amesbacteria bacterium]
MFAWYICTTAHLIMISLNSRRITLTWPLSGSTRLEPVRNPAGFLTACLVLLILISIGAWIFYFRQNLTLSYNDARSHLNIARRMVDSLQPGFAQIGSVWLPLFHILELPLVSNDYLWHSGIAGSLISMVSYVLGGIYLVRISGKLRFSTPAVIISLAVYCLNPNLIFLQTTPMTESLLLFLTIASVFYLLSWTEDLNTSSLVKAAFFTFLTTITRYDGWFLLAYMGLAVAYIGKQKKGWIFAQGNFFLFCTLAGFGIVLWLFWNRIIFGDFFYFVTGPFSAKAQQDAIMYQLGLATKFDFIYSLFVYLFTIRYNLGTWILILSLAGSGMFFSSGRYSRMVKVAVAALLTPFVFNVTSLFFGHSVIYLPDLPPYTWFNDRYGVMMLPAAALAIGFLAGRKKVFAALALAVIVIQFALMYTGNNIITIEDGVRGASGEYLDDAAAWIQNHAPEGLILVAASSNDALLFRSGLPLRRFITEGVRRYWDVALAEPSAYAAYVISHRGDIVDNHLRQNPDFLNNYRLVYQDSFSHIYRLDPGTATPLTPKDLP